MSDLYIQDIIETLEASVKDLVEKSKIFESLKFLPDKIPHILKLEKTLAQYKKKSAELKETLKSNKILIKTIKTSIPSFAQKLENKILDTKNSVSEENFIKALIEEKKAEIYIKEEICGLVKHIDLKIKDQHSSFVSDLQNTKTEVLNYKNQKINGEKVNDVVIIDQEIDENAEKAISRHADRQINLTKWKCEEIGENKLESLENSYQKIIKPLYSFL